MVFGDVTDVGRALRDADTANVRLYSGVSVALSAGITYAGVRLLRTNHPGWGSLLLLLGAGGLANNTIGLLTGKQYLTP